MVNLSIPTIEITPIFKNVCKIRNSIYVIPALGFITSGPIEARPTRRNILIIDQPRTLDGSYPWIGVRPADPSPVGKYHMDQTNLDFLVPFIALDLFTIEITIHVHTGFILDIT